MTTVENQRESQDRGSVVQDRVPFVDRISAVQDRVSVADKVSVVQENVPLFPVGVVEVGPVGFLLDHELAANSKKNVSSYHLSLFEQGKVISLLLPCLQQIADNETIIARAFAAIVKQGGIRHHQFRNESICGKRWPLFALKFSSFGEF